MKKTLLSALFLAAGLTAQAQLPNGSQAPDFTVTDINGNSHHLQEYLDAGKTVIMDLSATWCGPCWNYHNTHALEELYESYGYGASDEVVILFVEADPGTSLESLYGTNIASDQSTTQGNWVEGTPYPIINDTGAIQQAYALTYFPTIYRICPEGTTTLINQQTRSQLISGIKTGCAAELVGVENHPVVTAPELRLCENTGVVKAKMRNFGANKIQTATIVVEQNGAVIATKEYTGNLNQFSTANIVFDANDFDPSMDYKVKATVVNGVTAFNPQIAEQAFDVSVAQLSSNNVEIRVYTDSYPAEMSWTIKNSNDEIVASGGPYQGAAGGAAGGVDANQVIITSLTLPEGTMDCYKLTMMDSWGDGWKLNSSSQPFTGVRIYNASGLVGEFNGDVSFGTLDLAGAFKTSGLLGTATPSVNKFAVYPNPTTGVLNFSTTEAVNVTVTDLAGKTVFTAANVNNGGSINLGSLAKGMYIAQIKGAATQTVQKIIIE